MNKLKKKKSLTAVSFHSEVYENNSALKKNPYLCVIIL